jgi:hypothetical protein
MLFRPMADAPLFIRDLCQHRSCPCGEAPTTILVQGRLCLASEAESLGKNIWEPSILVHFWLADRVVSAIFAELPTGP